MTSIKDRVGTVTQAAVNLYETNKDELGQVSAPALDALHQAKDAYDLIKGKVGKAVDQVPEAKILGSKLKGMGVAGQAYGVVTGVTNLPGELLTAAKDARDAVRSGSQEDISKALASSKGALETGVKLAQDAGAMLKSIKAAAPEILKVATKVVGKAGVTTAVELAQSTVGKVVATEVGQAVLGKAAGRFVPGVNVAIAGIDTAVAVATLADSKASLGKKIAACVTAAGSIVAATNIPIVSQVGGAVSGAATVAGVFL